MNFQQYFQGEMLALRELAREALARNPALGPFFDTPGSDPAVERIFESFAFLGARLGRQLDDELPEITHGLFGRLWPNYLRPLPSASIIQYEPTSNTTNAATVPRGTMVEAAPVDGTRCRFQTVYDVDLLPLRVVEQSIIQRNGTVVVAVRFALTGGNLQSLLLSRLRVFFTGEKTIPHTLYMTLTHRLKELRFIIKDGGQGGEYTENITAALPPSCVRPMGFHEADGMLPYPGGTELGHRILQEYFCYPEKFLFVEINGLEQGLSPATRQRFQASEEFELHFVLDALPEGYEAFQATNWNLYCTPVINIFPFSTKSQQIAGGARHKIVPDEHHPDHYAVYSVEGVETWGERGKTGEAGEDAGVYDYTGLGEGMRYHLHIAPALDQQQVETSVRIDGVLQPNVLFKLRLLCTNHTLPARLGLGDICVAAGSAGNAATPFKNILPVSPSVPPPCSDDILWKLLSNMSLNHIPLTDVPSFRAVIAVYAFRAMRDSGQFRLLEGHLQSIRAIQSPSADRIFNGVPYRGAQTQIRMDQSCFPCEGGMYLFGAALNEFLSMHAGINSFHQLTIKEVSSGKEYRWPARAGSRFK